jgi:CheY-like chemotaxis protein
LTEKKKNEEYLIVAKKQAEAAQEAEKHFLAKMSHEIRTPLNAILGMTSLLSETKISSEQEEYLGILQSSANILQKLISDILDLAKVTARQMEVTKSSFNLYTLTTSLHKSFSFKLKEKGLDFIFNFDNRINLEVISDELLINQILINLLSNASKFTAEGFIKLETRLLKKSEDNYEVEFIVEDTGIGIPEQNLESIFENFKQANENISKEFGGTGLGLAIVKQIIEILGGKISVKSKLGKGSTFSVILPFKINKDYQSNIPARTGIFKDNFSQLKILIAEDNPMNQKYISRLMEKWDIDFKIGVDGGIAWEMAQKENYDIILMDIQMPVMNGYEVTEHIRTIDNPNKETYIVALTASALKEHKMEAIEKGMDGFLSKPFQPNQLKEVLENFIEEKT